MGEEHGTCLVWAGVTVLFLALWLLQPFCAIIDILSTLVVASVKAKVS